MVLLEVITAKLPIWMEPHRHRHAQAPAPAPSPVAAPGSGSNGFQHGLGLGNAADGGGVTGGDGREGSEGGSGPTSGAAGSEAEEGTANLNSAGAEVVDAVAAGQAGRCIGGTAAGTCAGRTEPQCTQQLQQNAARRSDKGFSAVGGHDEPKGRDEEGEAGEEGTGVAGRKDATVGCAGWAEARPATQPSDVDPMVESAGDAAAGYGVRVEAAAAAAVDGDDDSSEDEDDRMRNLVEWVSDIAQSKGSLNGWPSLIESNAVS